MDAQPLADDPAPRLRAIRHREFEALRQDRSVRPLPGSADPEEPLASVTQVHASRGALMARIDAAEAAMLDVLGAWENDPARRGAHLLPEAPPSVPSPASAPDSPFEGHTTQATVAVAGPPDAGSADTLPADATPSLPSPTPNPHEP